MNYGYRVKIYGKHVYKEAQLASNVTRFRIGTGLDCDLRFHKESFFEEFELTLNFVENEWVISCSDNVFVDLGDIRKIATKNLVHGDDFKIKYQESGNDVIRIEFLCDFDNEKKDYSRIIDVSRNTNVSIGNFGSANIAITGDYVENDRVELSRNNNDFNIVSQKTKYGIYINGRLAKTGDVINDGDFFSIANYSFYLRNGQLRTGTNVNVNGLNFIDLEEEASYPKFNRNTRLKTVIDETSIQVLDPPDKPQKPEGNIVMQLLPAVFMLGMTVVVRGFMSNSSNSSFIIFSACSMGMGIVTSVVSIITDRKKYKKGIADRIESYNDYINNKKEEIKACRDDELSRLNDMFIDTAKEIANVDEFSGDLFDKISTDDDFLRVRVGKGLVPAKRKISIKEQEKFASDDELMAIPGQVAEEYKCIEDAPVSIDCLNDNVVGIVGTENQKFTFVKSLTVDICTRHYYKDVQLFYLVDGDKIEDYIKWVKWFPHVTNPTSGLRNIVFDDDSKAQIFEYLYVELGKRAQAKKEEVFPNHIVIFVLNDWGIKTHPVSQYITNAAALGATFIFLENQKKELPLGCEEVIFLEDNYYGTLVKTSEKDNKAYFKYDAVQDFALERIARRLAPVYCEEISLENTLTKSISLYGMLNILRADDIDLTKRWASTQIYKSMAAPLGVKTKNELVYLDLHEKAHGPHGLVAGTTGSGKSEILQAYILSMATLYHPYEVGFVVIDFKGGGMVNQFKDLPHLIGAITNIDGREIDRSLMSIKAELEKRQRLFAENDVNNISNYIKLYKAGKIKTPIPHLIIIVDEFAELKAEQPEFMKELISAARIGRSLGVHLILATQKPSGQVNEQIWSNSKFKLCLKVQTKEDSNEVLKSPLAAEIREPGRAYLQVGNNEIFELFQSAYSGAPASSDDSNTAKEYSISELDYLGRRKVVFQQKKEKRNDVMETQLDAVVAYVAKYCIDNNIEKLPNICLPPLKDIIEYPERAPHASGSLLIPVGIFDDPTRQLQAEGHIDLSAGNLVIVGASQFGKTNFLQLLNRYLAESFSPKEVSIYILDFGSMALRVFESLNHVGGVIISSEDEKLKNFYRMIMKEVAVRKDRFANLGITSFNSYKEAGYTDIPFVVVEIDNYIAYKELYPQYDETFLNLCRECISVGICIVLTSSAANSLGYKYMSNFPNRVALYCNTRDEYGSLFERCKMEPKSTPGRGIIQMDKMLYEFQSYIAFQGEREIDRVQNVKNFTNKVNSLYPDCKAKQIPSIPAVVDEAFVKENCSETRPYMVPVGMNYENVEFFPINMLKTPNIGIMGREKMGKTNLVKIFMNYCQKHVFDYNVEAYLVDGYEKQLEQFSSFGFVEQYTTDVTEIALILSEIEQKLNARKLRVQTEGPDCLKDEPLLMCVIENPSAFEPNVLNKDVVECYKRIVSNLKQFKVMIIFSNVPNMATGFGASELLKTMKEVSYMFLMEDVPNIKVTDLGAAFARQNKKPLEPGDAYVQASDGTVTKLRTIFEK